MENNTKARSNPAFSFLKIRENCRTIYRKLMTHDYFLAFVFYLAFSLFAPLGLLAVRLFISSFRSAYAVSKLLGLLLFGYLIWLLSTARFLDFQNIFFIKILLVFTICVAVFLLIKNWPHEWRSKKGENNIASLLLIETFWIILYFAYLWLRSHNAEIHGTERFMDMAFFNASGMTNYFPPTDPWRAGYPINYYYYGHYLFSLVSNIAGVGANYAYTFTLGIIFSSASMLAWAFARSFSNSKIFASLASFLVVVSGTAAFGACVIKTAGTCSYVKSTRLYEPSYIINEIPSYSFTVGDLHAHLIALPFFLVALFFLHALFERERIGYGLIGILAVILTSLGMMNPWDFVSLAMIVFLIVVFKIFRSNWKMLIAKMALLGFISIILMLPFLSHFESGASGIGFAPLFVSKHGSPSDQQYPTPFLGWLGIWGGFIAVLALCVAILRKKFFNTKNFSALMVFAGALLLIGVELFFVRDIYSLANPPYFRANTVFKFGFHAWTLFALATMILSAEVFREYKSRILSVAIIALVFIGLFYPIRAINEFYLSSFSPRTLDGALFLKTLYPDDYAAIDWLEKNIKERNVLVEAAGDSYTDYGRIGVFSGMINPINWLTHEWGWRFKPESNASTNSGAPVESGWSKIATVSGEVRRIYESKSTEETRSLLQKYGAKFVYIGDIERKEYPNLIELKFHQLGQVVFSSGNSKLFMMDI